MRVERIGFLVFCALLALGLAASRGAAQNEQTQLYVFCLPNCGPCRQIEPDVARLVREGYPVQTIDCQTQPQWANHFQITQTPTIVLVRSGQAVARHVGPLNYAELVGLFRSAGFSPQAAVDNAGAAQVDRTSAAASNTSSPTVPRAGVDAAGLNGTPQRERAHQATVRLKVDDPQGTSYGTGTVIHRHKNAYLAVTCGHIFRDSRGQGVITVDHGFASGAPQSVRGELLSYDAQARDVALVVFESPVEIEPVTLAPPVLPVQRSDRVFTIGCDHGAPPSLVESQIIRSAIYDGAKKYDTVGRPVDGRSGGGLFSDGGQLIGICNAAAVEVDEGVFSSLENIYWQLDQSKLAHLFDATADTGLANADLEPVERNSEVAAEPGLIAAPRAVPVSSPPAEFTHASGVEVIVIVRPKSDPDQMRTFTVTNPSPQWIAQLESMSVGAPDSRLADQRAAMAGSTTEHHSGLVIRGQSDR